MEYLLSSVTCILPTNQTYIFKTKKMRHFIHSYTLDVSKNMTNVIKHINYRNKKRCLLDIKQHRNVNHLLIYHVLRY